MRKILHASARGLDTQCVKMQKLFGRPASNPSFLCQVSTFLAIHVWFETALVTLRHFFQPLGSMLRMFDSTLHNKTMSLYQGVSYMAPKWNHL